MTTEAELEIRCKIASAKLQVAEELRMPMSAFAALLAYSYWSSWIISVIVVFAVLMLVPYWYGKEYDKVWDEYEKATGTGKYYKPRQADDA